MVDSENWRKLIWILFLLVVRFLEEDLKNIVFVIIVKNNKVIKYDNCCILLNGFFLGWIISES